MKKISFFLFFASIFFISCSPENSNVNESLNKREGNLVLDLPEGFSVEVFADNLGAISHIVSTKNGDIYVRLQKPNKEKSVVALRDSDKDAIADRIEYFALPEGGHEIQVHKGFLYFSTNSKVYRQRLSANNLVPDSEAELVLNIEEQGLNQFIPFTFDAAGNMFVAINTASNVCQYEEGKKESLGIDPCPLLEHSGGIWKFSDSKLNQTFVDGNQYATGIRRVLALLWNNKTEKLYATQEGRAKLKENWPDLYEEKEGFRNAADEFFVINEGDDFGWPYCYYDWEKSKKILNPEYGGNRDSIGRCGNARYPIMALPSGWKPFSMAFYHENKFPVRFKGGAFLAFNDGWRKAPLPQEGFKVVFIPFSGDIPMTGYENFANGFAGEIGDPEKPKEADYKPSGLTVGSDGSLYIADSQKGRIWKVSYADPN